MENQVKQRRGFTLIELIISTAVILMMLAVTLPAFVSFQRRQSLLVAAQQIRDLILETQNYAYAPRGEEDGLPGKEAGADLYRIAFINNPDQPGYEISEQVVEDTTNGTWRQVRRGSLPYGVYFRCFPSTTPSIATDRTANPLPASEDGIGLVYSIRQLGKVLRPIPPNGQEIRIVIRQQSLAESYVIAVQPQTGRVDVYPSDDPAVCV